MYMGYPSDISKSVAQLDSFHLEFCWMESPGKRQRLVRTYDSAGLAVSSTHFLETKVWSKSYNFNIHNVLCWFCKFSSNLTNLAILQYVPQYILIEYILSDIFAIYKMQKFMRQVDHSYVAQILSLCCSHRFNFCGVGRSFKFAVNFFICIHPWNICI